MTLRIRGKDLTAPCKMVRNGIIVPLPEGVPEAALPDCVTCEKPDLDEDDHEAVMVYSYVRDQQQINAYTGDRLGVRVEAVLAVIRFFERRGIIFDVDGVFLRIPVLDRVSNRLFNTKLADARRAAEAASKSHK